MGTQDQHWNGEIIPSFWRNFHHSLAALSFWQLSVQPVMKLLVECHVFTGINLGMGSVNERRRYIVTPPLIWWAHTQTDPWFSRIVCDSLYTVNRRGICRDHVKSLMNSSNSITVASHWSLRNLKSLAIDCLLNSLFRLTATMKTVKMRIVRGVHRLPMPLTKGQWRRKHPPSMIGDTYRKVEKGIGGQYHVVWYGWWWTVYRDDRWVLYLTLASFVLCNYAKTNQTLWCWRKYVQWTYGLSLV